MKKIPFIDTINKGYSVIMIRRMTPLFLKVQRTKIKFHLVLMDKFSYIVDSFCSAAELQKYFKVDENITLAFIFVVNGTNNYFVAYPALQDLIFDDKIYSFKRLFLKDNFSKIVLPAVYSNKYSFDSIDSAISRAEDYYNKFYDMEQLQLSFDNAPF